MLNRRMWALTAACSVLISSVSCGNKDESERKAEDVAKAAKSIVADDYSGFIASATKYCTQDDETFDYRKAINEKADVDYEWLIIADNGELRVYYADTWNEKAVGQDGAKNKEKLTLAEMFEENGGVIHETKEPSTGSEESLSGAVSTTTTTATTTTTSTTTTAATTTTAPPKQLPSGVGAMDSSVGNGGRTFTIASWNADDAPALLASWQGETDFEYYKEQLKMNNVDNINFINFNVGGGNVSEHYDVMLNSGEDLDVYFCEADWAMKYINDDSRTLALSKLGLGDECFRNIYSYTDDVGRSTVTGERKGVSWQAAVGGFAYRADLAEKYLGVKDPEEMQAKIDDWDKFVSTACDIADQTNGRVALADSIGGLWQAFSCARSSPWVVDGRVTIDDSCEAFANIAKVLWETGGVTHNNQWSDEEWTGAGVDGSCMGYFVSTWGFNGFFMDAVGDNYGKWALCQGPTPYYWGGTWIVVNPKTDNGSEARDFIYASVCDPQRMRLYAMEKPEFVNNAAIMNDLISRNVVFNDKVTGAFKDRQNIYSLLADSASMIGFNDMITQYDAVIKSAFVSAVQWEYCYYDTDWDSTVDSFMDEVHAKVPSLK